MATGPRKSAGSSTSRKSVTIDLEAEQSDMPDEADAPAAEPVAMDQAPSAEDTASNADDTKKVEAASDQPEPVVTPVAPKSSGGSGLLGGLAGGLIALLGAGGLQWAGVLPNLGAVPTPEPAPIVDLAPVQNDIEDLRSQLAALASQPAGGETSAIEEQLAALSAIVDQNNGGLAEVQAQVQSSAGTLASLSAAVESGEAGDGAALQAVNNSVADLRSQLDDLAGQVATSSSAQSADIDLSPLESRIAEIETSGEATAVSLAENTSAIETLRADMEAGSADTNASVDALSATVAQLSEQVASGGADSTAVARAFAASSLKSAIDRGGAFATELEAFATISRADDAEAISTLREFAASGVPTLSQLVGAYPSAANAIIASERAVDEDTGLAGRLFGSMQGLVSVRPVDEQEGETPTAISTRIGARLAEGDLTAALAEWDALPEAAKAASQSFVDQVRARQTADSLMSQILTNAMSGAAGQ